ncbi:putative lipoprotein [Myxococcus hansupus]|uniref:Putative lipoprotein n=1 Tax=Pseudomyxococcus hansupus TaxID=1297742 RepID=A0A0H4X209_9BACT|nr:hypothetical protein [Myxococcus hansupus]AKQ67893.1 putative lipoprotein [Myxococcus hansupus]
MYRRVARLLPFCLLVTACGSSSRHQELLTRREAVRNANEAAAQEAFANDRSTDGFQETRWGMTREEVAALYPEAATDPVHGDMTTIRSVAERPARLDFVFVHDKLAAVTVLFDPADSIRKDFDEVAAALRMKYGTPGHHLDTAANAERRLRELESGDPRFADEETLREARRDTLRAQSQYTLMQQWNSGQMLVTLSGRQTPARSEVALVYQSVALKPYLDETLSDHREQKAFRQAQDL